MADDDVRPEEEEPKEGERDEELPLGQRLFDNPWLLLIAGTVVMLIFYTGWGWLEIASLGDAPLP